MDYYMGGEAPTVSTHTVFYPGCSLFPRRSSFPSILRLAVRESSTVHTCLSHVCSHDAIAGCGRRISGIAHPGWHHLCGPSHFAGRRYQQLMRR